MNIEMDSQRRRLTLSGAANARDLGGFPLPGGSLTRFGSFIRSNLPRSATAEDLSVLLAAGVDTVLDLRSAAELEREPCALAAFPQLRYLHCPTFIDNTLPLSAENVPRSYLAMIDEQGLLGAILRVLCEAKGGVLYHCTAGKDRTGVLSALLLELAGAADSDIIADYELTAVCLREHLTLFCDQHNYDPAIVIPQARHMRGFLDLLREKYGSAAAGLRAVGLTDGEIDCLRAKLVGPAAE